MHQKKKQQPDKIVLVYVFYVDLTKSKLDVQKRAKLRRREKK